MFYYTKIIVITNLTYRDIILGPYCTPLLWIHEVRAIRIYIYIERVRHRSRGRVRRVRRARSLFILRGIIPSSQPIFAALSRGNPMPLHAFFPFPSCFLSFLTIYNTVHFHGPVDIVPLLLWGEIYLHESVLWCHCVYSLVKSQTTSSPKVLCISPTNTPNHTGLFMTLSAGHAINWLHPRRTIDCFRFLLLQ